MNTEDLKTLLKSKQIVDFDSTEQDFGHGLRLVLRDLETGEMGLLAVEPTALILPDEIALDYSYQTIEAAGPVFDECAYSLVNESLEGLPPLGVGLRQSGKLF